MIFVSIKEEGLWKMVKYFTSLNLETQVKAFHKRRAFHKQFCYF